MVAACWDVGVGEYQRKEDAHCGDGFEARMMMMRLRMGLKAGDVQEKKEKPKGLATFVFEDRKLLPCTERSGRMSVNKSVDHSPSPPHPVNFAAGEAPPGVGKFISVRLTLICGKQSRPTNCPEREW